jgi:hypothetical protein
MGVPDAVGLGQSESILIGEQSAGDATAGIPGRITLVITRVCVDEKRRTIRVEHGIRTAFLQRDRRVQDFHGEFSARGNVEVRHIARIQNGNCRFPI